MYMAVTISVLTFFVTSYWQVVLMKKLYSVMRTNEVYMTAK